MKKKIIQKENHTHTDMHNGKQERIITRTTITILLKLLNYYKQQQTTRVKAPITTKKIKKTALRAVNRSKRLVVA